jgi:hypothetical protein
MFLSSRQTVTPGGLVAYTITCSDGVTTASDTVVVNVDSPVPTFALSATKTATGTGVGLLSVTDGTTSISNSPLDCGGNLPCTGVESGITFGLKRVITAHLGTNVAVSWSGDCESITTDASGNAVCTVTLTSDKSVTAKFDGPPVINTLSVCTDNGITPIDPSLTRGNLPLGGSENLRAFYDDTPGDCVGTDVTHDALTQWGEETNNSAFSLSVNGSLETVTAGNTPGASEAITLHYGTDTITLNYRTPDATCTPNCSDALNICSGTRFNASNCGTNNCTGTKSCDFNFREVSP